MIDQKKKKTYYDLMYLVSCALTGKVPVLDGLDLDQIKQEAIQDSILPLLGKVVPQFKDELFINAYRNVNFENCKNKLFKFLETQNIWHCPLKGIITKDLYPNYAMRFLADFDVLVDSRRKNDVRTWYKSNNIDVLYYRESRKGEKEDSILLQKQFHLELHYCLLNDNYKKDPWYHYFSNEELLKRMVKVSNSEYKMTNEDFYLFFLIHAYKHSNEICDIRGLIDCYLINEKMPYNKTYVKEKLIEFGLYDYENKVRAIGNKLIKREALSTEEEQYFIKCALNKTFGDLELNELRRIACGGEITQAVLKKAIRNLFIAPKENYKNVHPIIYKSIVLRPLYHFARIIKKIIKWKTTKEKILKYIYFKEQ